MSYQQRPDFGRQRRQRQRLGMLVGGIVVLVLLVVGVALLVLPSKPKENRPVETATQPPAATLAPTPTPEPSQGTIPSGMTLATLTCASGGHKTHLIIGRVADATFAPGPSAELTSEDATYQLSDPQGAGQVLIDLRQHQLAFSGGPLDGQTATYRGGNGRLNFELAAIAGSGADKIWVCAPAF